MPVGRLLVVICITFGAPYVCRATDYAALPISASLNNFFDFSGTLDGVSWSCNVGGSNLPAVASPSPPPAIFRLDGYNSSAPDVAHRRASCDGGLMPTPGNRGWFVAGAICRKQLQCAHFRRVPSISSVGVVRSGKLSHVCGSQMPRVVPLGMFDSGRPIGVRRCSS